MTTNTIKEEKFYTIWSYLLGFLKKKSVISVIVFVFSFTSFVFFIKAEYAMNTSGALANLYNYINYQYYYNSNNYGSNNYGNNDSGSNYNYSGGSSYSGSGSNENTGGAVIMTNLGGGGGGGSFVATKNGVISGTSTVEYKAGSSVYIIKEATELKSNAGDNQEHRAKLSFNSKPTDNVSFGFDIDNGISTDRIYLELSKNLLEEIYKNSNDNFLKINIVSKSANSKQRMLKARSGNSILDSMVYEISIYDSKNNPITSYEDSCKIYFSGSYLSYDGLSVYKFNNQYNKWEKLSSSETFGDARLGFEINQNGTYSLMYEPSPEVLGFKINNRLLQDKDGSYYIFVRSLDKDSDLPKKLAGKLLLRPEKNGESWYINPDKFKIYYLGQAYEAFQIVSKQGVGISDNNLDKIAISSFSDGIDSDKDGLSDSLEDALGTDKNNKDTDGDSYFDGLEIDNNYSPFRKGKLDLDNNFASKQLGRFLIQTDNNGELWYVNPDDGLRYYISSSDSLFKVVSKVGLGVSETDFQEL